MNSWVTLGAFWVAVVGACIAVPYWLWVGWEIYKQRKGPTIKG